MLAAAHIVFGNTSVRVEVSHVPTFCNLSINDMPDVNGLNSYPLVSRCYSAKFTSVCRRVFLMNPHYVFLRDYILDSYMEIRKAFSFLLDELFNNFQSLYLIGMVNDDGYY